MSRIPTGVNCVHTNPNSLLKLAFHYKARISKPYIGKVLLAEEVCPTLDPSLGIRKVIATAPHSNGDVPCDSKATAIATITYAKNCKVAPPIINDRRPKRSIIQNARADDMA